MEKNRDKRSDGGNAWGESEWKIDESTYPQLEGESDASYAQRLHDMNEYSKMAQEDGEKVEAEQAKVEYDASKLGKYEAYLRGKQEAGVYTSEEVDNMLESAAASFVDAERYEDWQKDQVPEGYHVIMLENGRPMAVPESIKDAQEYAEYQKKLQEDMGEVAIDAAELSGDDEAGEANEVDGAGKDDEVGESLSRDEMLHELKGRDALIWLTAQNSELTVNDLLALDDEQLGALHKKWEEFKSETEKLERDRMMDELSSREGLRWLVEQNPDMTVDDLKKLSDEELAKLYAEFTKVEADEEDKTLRMVAIDKSVDAKRKARDVAERLLKEDLEEGKGVKKFVKNIWKGQIFREYYLLKNEKKVHDEILKKQDENYASLDEIERENAKNFLIKRFISEYDEMRHAGEKQEVLGEDHRATKAAKVAIEKYAKGELDDANFTEEMKRIKQGLFDGEKLSATAKGDVVIDNYLEIAKAAKGRFEHEEGIDSILAGFEMVYGEARSGVRTEAHQSAMDKLMTRYEQGALTKFAPPEIVVAAASMGLWLTQGVGTSVVRAVTFGLGGVAVTGGVAAMKESGRVRRDRAQLAREMAMGEAVGETKYDKAMAETMYGFERADNLTAKIRAAMESGDNKQILAVLADVETRNKLSDTKKIDLIGFSGEADIEEERFALDLARAEAKVQLKQNGEKNVDELLDDGVNILRSTFEKDVDAKDALFKKLRLRQMTKVGIGAALTSATMMIGTQEIAAAFSPNQYGLLDKALNLENNPDMTTTMLTGMLGFKPEVALPGVGLIDRELTLQEIQELKAQGYVVEDVSYNKEVAPSGNVDMGVKEYAEKYGTGVSRDGWNSETGMSVQYTNNGEGFRVGGGTVQVGGENMSLAEAWQEGNLKAFVSLTGDTQATPIEVTGNFVVNNGQLEFVPEPESALADCFENGQFTGKFFEVALDNGVDANGVQHIVPISTVTGSGFGTEQTLSGVPTGTVMEKVTQFNVFGGEETIRSTLTKLGGVLIPFHKRDNLTSASGESGRTAAETYGDDTETYQAVWDDMDEQRRTEISNGTYRVRNPLFVKWLRENGKLKENN